MILSRKLDPARETGKRRAEQPFIIYVLLDDSLQFLGRELTAALAEDFPDEDWTGAEAMDAIPFDTNQVAVGGIGCGAGRGMAVLTGGVALPFNFDELFARNHVTDPDTCHRITTSSHHICITVNSTGSDLSARLAAARRATACAAVFAELPTATGVVMEWANRIIPAPAFAATSAAIRKGACPLSSWVLPMGGAEEGDAALHWVTSIGAAAFLGCEVETRMSPETLPDAATSVMAALSMMIDRGHAFRDGETVGDDAPDATRYRVRLVPEGLLDNDCDRWLVLHPDSPFKDRKVLGRPKSRLLSTPLAEPGPQAPESWFRKGLAALAKTTPETRAQ
ncbi:MAG: hypothetical protein AAFY65_00885 [Pseudomonadota bacterium]